MLEITKPQHDIYLTTDLHQQLQLQEKLYSHDIKVGKGSRDLPAQQQEK